MSKLSEGLELQDDDDDCLSPSALMSPPSGLASGSRGVRHVGSADVLEGLAQSSGQPSRARYRKVCFMGLAS